LGGATGLSSVSVNFLTIWNAAWFTSEGRVLIRFGIIESVCH
jgi:hypothetical protein